MVEGPPSISLSPRQVQAAQGVQHTNRMEAPNLQKHSMVGGILSDYMSEGDVLSRRRPSGGAGGDGEITEIKVQVG